MINPFKTIGPWIGAATYVSISQLSPESILLYPIRLLEPTYCKIINGCGGLGMSLVAPFVEIIIGFLLGWLVQIVLTKRK